MADLWVVQESRGYGDSGGVSGGSSPANPLPRLQQLETQCNTPRSLTHSLSPYHCLGHLNIVPTHTRPITTFYPPPCSIIRYHSWFEFKSCTLYNVHCTYLLYVKVYVKAHVCKYDVYCNVYTTYIVQRIDSTCSMFKILNLIMHLSL